MMKEFIFKIVNKTTTSIFEEEVLQNAKAFNVEKTKNKKFGDFSCNVSMILAPHLKKNPRKIAETIKQNIESDIVEKIDIAGAGFLNFFLKKNAYYPFLKNIHNEKNKYGKQNIGKNKKVMVEFVSANPTGPLHIGHGRGAVLGDVLSNLLIFLGYNVSKEYYLNDKGKQVETLGNSVLLRKQELDGKKIEFPKEYYKGDYIKEIAKEMPADANAEICAEKAMSIIVDDIKKTLNKLNINFDSWFSEKSLYENSKVEKIIKKFTQKNLIYEKEGALWFRSSATGDEKDRVIKKSNGDVTYLTSDIAYHKDKFDRGFETVIDIWGADHHGYIERIKSAVEAMGKNRDDFEALLVQLVNLFENKKPVSMSKRKGTFITLDDLISEVGNDATRFMFLTRHHESTLDFDLEVAKKKTNENPVYYVQYVHARITSILKRAESENIDVKNIDIKNIELLKEAEEIDLIKIMMEYPETLKLATEKREPHRITFYLMELSSLFHSYYNKHKVLSENKNLSLARLYLISAVKIVTKNGLSILGVSAPNKM